ncbi:hypothetical protein ESCOMMO057M_19105 [Escherichia coli]
MYAVLSITYIPFIFCDHIINLMFYIITYITVLCSLINNGLMPLMVSNNILAATTRRYALHSFTYIPTGFTPGIINTRLYLFLNKRPRHRPTAFCNLRRTGICQNSFCILRCAFHHILCKLLRQVFTHLPAHAFSTGGHFRIFMAAGHIRRVLVVTLFR